MFYISGLLKNPSTNFPKNPDVAEKNKKLCNQNYTSFIIDYNAKLRRKSQLKIVKKYFHLFHTHPQMMLSYCHNFKVFKLIF